MNGARPGGCPKPSVAVVVPNHERVACLEASLDSVRAQTYGGPIQIYVAYRPRLGISDLLFRLGAEVVLLPVVSEEGRNSISVKRNTALARVTEEYVAFLDDDDLWHPDKIAVQVAALVRHPNAVGVSSLARTFCNEVSWPFVPTPPAPRVLSAHRILRGEIAMSSLVVRSDIAKALRFDERPDWLAVEDYDFKLRLGQRGQIGRIHELLTGLRVGEPSISQPDRRLQGARMLDVLATTGGPSWPIEARLVGVELAAVLAVAGEGPPSAAAMAQVNRALDGRLYGRLDDLVRTMILQGWRLPKCASAVRAAGHLVRGRLLRRTLMAHR